MSRTREDLSMSIIIFVVVFFFSLITGLAKRY